MRRTWAWSLAVLTAGTVVWLTGLGAKPTQAQEWVARVLGSAALALSLELAWRTTFAGTPVYRRHLAIFGALALLAAGDGLHQAFVPAQAGAPIGFWSAWLTGLLGAFLGLAGTCLPVLKSRAVHGLGWRRGTARRSDPGVPLILVADPHWSEALTGLREARAAHPEADWLFLGDVFDVWVGVRGMDCPLEREFLDWVAATRRDGRWVGLWLGNREYFLDALAERFDLMGEGTGGRLAGERLTWEHGDLVNVADWRYRLWNLVSRSGPVWLLARLLPRTLARRLAEGLQRALHTRNRAYKLAFPREAFRAAAAEHPSETFITGHFHTHEVEGNGIALPWAHEGDFMVWHQGEVKPLSALAGPSSSLESGGGLP